MSSERREEDCTVCYLNFEPNDREEFVESMCICQNCQNYICEDCYDNMRKNYSLKCPMCRIHWSGTKNRDVYMIDKEGTIFNYNLNESNDDNNVKWTDYIRTYDRHYVSYNDMNDSYEWLEDNRINDSATRRSGSISYNDDYSNIGPAPRYEHNTIGFLIDGSETITLTPSGTLTARENIIPSIDNGTLTTTGTLTGNGTLTNTGTLTGNGTLTIDTGQNFSIRNTNRDDLTIITETINFILISDGAPHLRLIP